MQILNVSPDCEIVNSRVINFSRDLIFRAWTDPYHLKNWWGPKGFTNTFSEFDLRPGGTWKFVIDITVCKPERIGKNQNLPEIT